MELEIGHIYHIYNQGNNHQTIFFGEKNYLFFLKKMRTHLLPFGDVLAYCLMPNHFHIMFMVNRLVPQSLSLSRGATLSRTPTKAHPIPTNLNKEIGILLASYTRAINKQENRSGSLFRQKTKAVCLTLSEGVSRSYYNSEFGTYLDNSQPEKEHVQVCFDYIHQNPVKAKLVHQSSDWEYSSARDYAGTRCGTLVNIELARSLIALHLGRDFKSHSK